MRTIKILDEFSDYRKYVSHTLCQNRLFLGLDTLQGARRRVGDAGVWPLTGTESRQLIKLSGPLCGLVSKPLKQKIDTPMKKALDMMDKETAALLKSDEEAYSAFYASATQLKTLLTSISMILRENPPEFSEETVLKHFDGCDRKTLIGLFAGMINSDLKQTVSEIISGGNTVDAAYSEFWNVYSQLQTKFREINVAGAVEDIPDEDDNRFRQAFRNLQKVERLISCWSPTIEEAERRTTIEHRLEAEGINAIESLPDVLERIVEAL